jgi:hypothetical protein
MLLGLVVSDELKSGCFKSKTRITVPYRLRKNSQFKVKLAENVPPGLKPDSVGFMRGLPPASLRIEFFRSLFSRALI